MSEWQVNDKFDGKERVNQRLLELLNGSVYKLRWEDYTAKFVFFMCVSFPIFFITVDLNVFTPSSSSCKIKN